MEDEDEGGREGELQAPWTGKPFVWLDRNPLVVYVGHCLLHDHFPFNVANDGGSVVGAVGRGLPGVGAWVGVTWWLGERRGWYVKA